VEDVRMKTNGRVALIAHCLLNQNSKPYLRARFPGTVWDILDVLKKHDFALFQLPCPEVAFTGLNRFSAVIDQYDTPKYREHCRDLSVMVLDQLQQYPSYNYKLLLIGLDGSPSCGVDLTGTSKEWRGHPTNIKTEGYPVQPGSGVLMQELCSQFEARGMEVPPAFGVGLDVHGVELDKVSAAFEKQLQEVLKEF